MARIFDRKRLRLFDLEEREHDLDLTAIMPLIPVSEIHGNLLKVAHRIVEARERGSSVVMMMGAHVLRSGVQRFLRDLMETGLISCLAMNGACVIHDFELALLGKTTESVSRYIHEGKFGLWRETGLINDIVKDASDRDLGLGEAVGRAIAEGDFPHKELSVLASGYRLDIPLTVHAGIGYDIVHEHPNCDGAAWGKTSYRDFLEFAKVLESLEGGVIMNFGSAVMAPEVFLKALAMVRNVAARQQERIRCFTALVCDLYPLPENYQKEAPKEDPAYYFRPWKTMLVRTVRDGGEGFYVNGPHAKTIPALWTAIKGVREKS
jgi:hypothetical protein